MPVAQSTFDKALVLLKYYAKVPRQRRKHAILWVLSVDGSKTIPAQMIYDVIRLKNTTAPKDSGCKPRKCEIIQDIRSPGP